jgi:hypothetical protein
MANAQDSHEGSGKDRASSTTITTLIVVDCGLAHLHHARLVPLPLA